MEGDITLIDLQTAVFQSVPGIIGELDEIADIKAINVPTDEPHPSLKIQKRSGFQRKGDKETIQTTYLKRYSDWQGRFWQSNMQDLQARREVRVSLQVSSRGGLLLLH